MNPKRWQQIEALYQSARELEPGQRDALLAEACAGDEELRREVESLLRHQPDDDNFRTAAALQIAAQALAQDPVNLSSARRSDPTRFFRFLASVVWARSIARKT